MSEQTFPSLTRKVKRLRHPLSFADFVNIRRVLDALT